MGLAQTGPTQGLYDFRAWAVQGLGFRAWGIKGLAFRGLGYLGFRAWGI